MANFRSIILTITFLTIQTNLSDALFEDQVGKFDWKRSFLGKVKWAEFDNKRLFVATEQNVIASLNLKNDQIQWRQAMESPDDHHKIELLHVDRDLITVSGNKNNYFIRGWESASGSLLFEWTVTNERGLDSLWGLQDETLVHVVPVKASHFEVTHYNAKTGELRWKKRKIGAPFVGGPNKCTVTDVYFACISNGQVFWLDLFDPEAKTQSHSIQSLIGEIEGTELFISKIKAPGASFLLVKDTTGKLVELDKESIKVLPQTLNSDAICIENMIYQLEANLNNPEKIIKVTSSHLKTDQKGVSIEIDYPLGLGGPSIVAGQCKGTSCHLLVTSTDDALTLVHLPEGKVIWSREEALSNILAVEFFELPVSEMEASIEKEFTETSNDVINMFIHRISTQLRQLYTFFIGGQIFGTSALVRDDFGLHRMIVVATASGKLFGIDTLSGSIVWTYRLPNVEAFTGDKMLLLAQRTARHAPLRAQCVLLARDSNSGRGISFTFDPISGESSRGVQRLSYNIKQAFLLHQEDDNRIKPLVVIDNDNNIHVVPEDAKTIVQKHGNSNFVYIISDGVMRGYKLDANLVLRPVWDINLGPSVVVGVSTRPISERVHSQGRVRPDRSVYYKYVNPNLIAIATLSEDPIHKHVLSVYLIDGVTGLVLYATAHKKAKGPVHLVHSENWLVYSFFNERFRRNEIVAAEMYEGPVQSNSTAFSSFAVSQLPQVQTQAYIIPSTPVTMTVTLTERGITNKFLLVGMTSGNVMEIPWMLLEPRFADIPCGPEENCIPYMPEIPMPSEAVINYNQTLGRIRKIEVAPAKLESTCHVLVHGLDLFYTRVAPSKTFDLLKEDFDYKLIVIVLTGLCVASYVTKHLAAKKTQRQAWK